MLIDEHFRETVTDTKASKGEASGYSAPDEEATPSKRHSMIRIIIAVTNIVFLLIFIFWLCTLFTGLHVADVGFINNMFMG
uniref:C4-dicarboxylate ABC transporter n=1 Tax=Caenorhabditis tropicalis TaxID=1561998 RepID=A0A1I7UHG5_9PELO